MKRPWIQVIGSAGVFVGAICLGDDLQNRQLLETLPRDRRVTLSENLDRFDRLSSADQSGIRRLDATIATTEPVEQARFRSLLQHYHTWVQGLSDEQREQLIATADLSERFALARKFRLAEKASNQRGGPRIAQIRTGEFGLLGPFEAANLLRIWNELPPEKRAEIAKNPPLKIREEVKAQANTLKIRNKRFPDDQEKIYTEKLENDNEFKPVIEPMLRRIEQTIRKGDPKKADQAQKKFEHPFAEFLYFEDHRPQVVDTGRLERFVEAVSERFRIQTDSLSPDDARDYYTSIYRLIYPSPTEMPDPAKTPKAADAARKPARPKSDAGISPF